MSNDSKLMVSFFNNKLEPNNLFHSIIVHQYLSLLMHFDIKVEEALKAKFKSPEYELYDLFTNKFERLELKFSHSAYRDYRNKKIKKLTESYSKDDYNKIFYQIFNVLQIIDGHSKWQIDQGILAIFEELSKRNPDLLLEVVRQYLEQSDYLEVNPWSILYNFFLLYKENKEKIFNIINSVDYPTKKKWLFSYYQQIPVTDIEQGDIEALCELYKKTEYKYFINDFDYLLKYESVQKGFISNVVQIIVERAKFSPEFAHSLYNIFNHYKEINKNLTLIFSDKYELLEEAYIAIDRVGQHSDYEGQTLTVLLDNDRDFMVRLLKDKFSRKDYFRRSDDNRDYSFIWLLEDYFALMQKITHFVFEQESEGRCYDYYKLFYNKNRSKQSNDDLILQRQDGYLLSEIEEKFSNSIFMQFLFRVIVTFELGRKLIFYRAFLDKNKIFGDFESIPFQPTISSWSGSAVPMLQGKIDFYEEIIKLCNSVELLKHRQFIEKIIKEIRNQIQHEKKKDFTEFQ